MRKTLPVLALLALAAASQAIVTDVVPGTSTGLYTNAFLGATTFYAHGYSGAGTIVANVEDEVGRTNPAALGAMNLTQTFVGNGANALVGPHPTACLDMIGGLGDGSDKMRGIAYGTELWSGSFGSSYLSDGGISFSDSAFFSTYHMAMVSGVNGTGRTADVVSSSWSGYYTDSVYGPALAGGAYYSQIVDALSAASHKLVVVAAGNNGAANDPDAPWVSAPGFPANGYNALSVGSTAIAQGYKMMAADSSHGYSPYWEAKTRYLDLTGEDLTASGTAHLDVPRVTVDIVAPGERIVYLDVEDGEVGYGIASGTSFSAPQVAGGAALVVEAGRSLGYGQVADNRPLSAILMNSADRLSGWTNEARDVAGVWTTDQALDESFGAGQMNLDRAYTQLTAGTTDVPGLGGGAVDAVGWDLGSVDFSGSNLYTLDLTAGMEFTATLRWDAGMSFGALDENTPEDNGLYISTQLGYDFLSDLRLDLLSADGTLLATSDAKAITTEHFVYDLTRTGSYLLRVSYLGDNYNFVGDHGAVGYGLAWYQGAPQAVPEPSAFAALGLGALAVLRRRRKA